MVEGGSLEGEAVVVDWREVEEGCQGEEAGQETSRHKSEEVLVVEQLQ